jgi:subtilisin family serine protease
MRLFNIVFICFFLLLPVFLYPACKEAAGLSQVANIVIPLNKINNIRDLKRIKYIKNYYEFKNAPYIDIQLDKSSVEKFKDLIFKKFNIKVKVDGFKKPFYVIPDDPLFYDQWYLDYMGVPKLWDYLQTNPSENFSSKETIIAIIDTGVDLDHPELKNKLWINPYEVPNNGIDDDMNDYIDDIHGINSDCMGCKSQNIDATECSNHGTFMAGIIAAEKNNSIGIAGLAPDNTRVMICKAGTDNGMANSSVFRCIDYIIEMKKRGFNIIAINMSYGGSQKSDVEEHLLSQLAVYNILPVIAAGNEDNNLDFKPTYPASYKLDYSIVVGSFNPKGKKSSYSNFGTQTVDIFAPGDDILTTAYVYGEHGYGVASGTSISTPMVASAIAYIYNFYPASDIYRLKEHLIDNSLSKRKLRFYGKSGKTLDFENLLN